MRKCPKCGRGFDPPTRICPDDGTLLRDTVSQEEQPIGRTLDGKYRIDGFLKRGGMGAVYRGTHVLLNKAVAIKLIRPEIVTSTEMVERFFREARAAAKLGHPNIVTVHDLGQTEDGTLYIVMELVEGQSLKEVIQKEGPMAPERALALAKGIANALALAHRNDIVHRDLKPQNIMVAVDAEGHETPKLLDFGIAKTLEPDTPALTSTGMVLGTPHYMSSEQAKGKPADRRSDLYALGVILYEMLVGKVPFDDTSIPSILVKHLTEPPKPPSTLRQGIPPSVEAVVLRCLEKEPEKRFQNATEFIKAIDLPSKASATVPPIAPAPLEPTVAATALTPPPVPQTSAPEREGAQHTMAGAAAAVANGAPHFESVSGGRSSSSSGTVRAHQATPNKGSHVGVVVFAAIILFLLGGVAAAYFVIRALVAPRPDTPEPAPIVASSGPEADAEPEVELDGASQSENPADAEAGHVPAPELPRAAAAASTPSPSPTPTPQPPPTQTPPAAATQRLQPPPPPAAPPQPEPDPVPAQPTFSIDCQGVRDACGALRVALRDALVKEGMQPARAPGAEILVTLEVEEVESRTEAQFGTTFVVRTYSVSGDADVPRFGDLVALPAHTFSFDVRFGRDKLSEQARVISTEAADELARYWTSKTR